MGKKDDVQYAVDDLASFIYHNYDSKALSWLRENAVSCRLSYFHEDTPPVGEVLNYRPLGRKRVACLKPVVHGYMMVFDADPVRDGASGTLYVHRDGEKGIVLALFPSKGIGYELVDRIPQGFVEGRVYDPRITSWGLADRLLVE